MRFFTPELFVRFNSADDDQADEANGAWEAALCAYRRHLSQIGNQLSPSARQLSELCPHDAELLPIKLGTELPAAPLEPHSFSEVAILPLQQEGQIVLLVYSLWDHIRESPPAPNWPFSKFRPHWLYDEVDLAPRTGEFVHRVLVSDGRVLEIPFLSVVLHSFAVETASEGGMARHSA